MEGGGHGWEVRMMYDDWWQGVAVFGEPNIIRIINLNYDVYEI